MKNLLFLIMFGVISCTDLDDIAYDQFTLYKKFQYSGQIKTNGEYLAYDSIHNIYKTIYLYKDGSMFAGGNGTKNSLLTCTQISNGVRDVGWWWGFFNIENGRFITEGIDPSSINRHSKYQVDKSEGRFINDSTFTLVFFEQPNNVKRELYCHFRYCTSKPDSMNVILRNIDK